jgi:hypothetical protein
LALSVEKNLLNFDIALSPMLVVDLNSVPCFWDIVNK